MRQYRHCLLYKYLFKGSLIPVYFYNWKDSDTAFSVTSEFTKYIADTIEFRYGILVVCEQKIEALIYRILI